jgi:MoxR-like ATPase
VALIGRAVESVKLRESARRAEQRDDKLEAEAEEEEKKEEEKKAAREKKKKALAMAKAKKLDGKVSKLRKRDIMWERRNHGQWE